MDKGTFYQDLHLISRIMFFKKYMHRLKPNYKNLHQPETIKYNDQGKI